MTENRCCRCNRILEGDRLIFKILFLGGGTKEEGQCCLHCAHIDKPLEITTVESCIECYIGDLHDGK